MIINKLFISTLKKTYYRLKYYKNYLPNTLTKYSNKNILFKKCTKTVRKTVKYNNLENIFITHQIFCAR